MAPGQCSNRCQRNPNLRGSLSEVSFKQLSIKIKVLLPCNCLRTEVNTIFDELFIQCVRRLLLGTHRLQHRVLNTQHPRNILTDIGIRLIAEGLVAFFKRYDCTAKRSVQPFVWPSFKWTLPFASESLLCVLVSERGFIWMKSVNNNALNNRVWSSWKHCFILRLIEVAPESLQ